MELSNVEFWALQHAMWELAKLHGEDIAGIFTKQGYFHFMTERAMLDLAHKLENRSSHSNCPMCKIEKLEEETKRKYPRE